MNIRWKEWIIIAGWILCSFMLLMPTLTGNMTTLLSAIVVMGFISLVIMDKCPAYLAFGILAPFGVSLWIVTQVPTIALVLLLCMIAISLRATVQRHGVRYMGRLEPLAMIFFLYLLVRYACDPVLPGYAIGVSNDITGFRSWFNCFINMIIFLCLGFAVTSLDDVQSLFRWLALFSLLFTIVFIGLMFAPGYELSAILKSMGIFVSTFSNGWRRFVFLPSMGTFLIMASLLPFLFHATSVQRRFYVVAGFAAIIAGGGRGSALFLLIIVGITLMLKRRLWAMASLCSAVVGLAVMANAMIGQWSASTETPWVRVMGAFSPGLSTDIGAMGTMEWRYIRWNRAIEDIKQHPWVGMGYGGIKDYFGAVSDITETSPDLDVERDVAIGATHNGYISLARNMGIPITVLFVVILIRRIRFHWRKARQVGHPDVLGEANIFLCAYLAGLMGVMIVSGDIMSPTIWVFLTLSFVVERLDSARNSSPSCCDLNKDGSVPVQIGVSPNARFS